MEFKDRLKELRDETGKMQKDFAAELEINAPKYSRLESGKQQPSIQELIQLAEYFHVTIDYLLGFSDSKKPENTALIEELGLTNISIENLKSLFSNDPFNSITLTVNSLLENKIVLGELSKYLYYSLEEKGGKPIDYWESYRYIDLCKDKMFAQVEGKKHLPPIDYYGNPNRFNNEDLSEIHLLRVQNEIKEMKSEEDKKIHFKDTEENAEDI